MTFMYLWPLWATAFITLILAAACFAGWKKTQDTTTWVRRALMVACIALLGLTPATKVITEERISNAEYYFIIDLTGSMAAEDYDGDGQRLDGVKTDIRDIIEQNPGAQYSVIAFSSTATEQLPLTTDSRAVLAWLDTARRESSNRSQGSSINRPRDEIEAVLTRSMDNNPQNVRVTLFFTDGENTDTQQTSSDESVDYGGLADMVDDGYVFGYGTEEGGRMSSSQWGIDEDWDYITDPATGQPAISKIDEENLVALAEQLDIEYVHRDSPGGAGNLVTTIPYEMIAGDGREERGALNPLLWPIGLALLVLVGWELWHITPRIASLRRAQ